MFESTIRRYAGIALLSDYSDPFGHLTAYRSSETAAGPDSIAQVGAGVPAMQVSTLSSTLDSIFQWR